MSDTGSGDLQSKNEFQHLELSESGPPVQLEGAVHSSSMESSTSRQAVDWPQWKKNTMILMVSFHSMISVFMAAGVVPAVSSLAESYGVSLADASYLVSFQIVLLGIAPIFWIVITERYGRHYILIFSVLASMVCNIGGARCDSYASQIITRVLTAAFISPPIGIGSGVVAELSTPDEYARKVGWWVLMTILGTPAGPFIMGFVVQHIRVEFIFWIFAIINFLQAVAYICLGGETLRVREPENDADAAEEKVSIFRGLLPKRLDARPIRISDFVSPFRLAKNPRILIAALATAITFCYANIVFVVEMPLTFGEKFHLDAQQTGLQFIPIIIGCVIGEQIGGPMSDYFMKVYRKRKGRVCPADRLWLTYIGFLTIIAGQLVWGFQLERAKSWNVTPCVGIAIASFGNQIQSTILTAYAIDTSPSGSASIGVLFNVIRLLYGFTNTAGLMSGIVVVGGIIPTLIVQVTSPRE
ncbi:MFS transporter [Aspergillus costaricaensis CBS 115574]|uniref:MFS transporter n=1 Tax=Aspergillus costaricaensis CBS 115574 TaxID=1448317 RepID=A0ACD1IUK3_9EURO|nr:MFS transporter [Aspergillus costaricaensis CBS 115574]RAK93809.1 MFS transporter [Aspergillus costaricaensis CBS 115574]